MATVMHVRYMKEHSQTGWLGASSKQTHRDSRTKKMANVDAQSFVDLNESRNPHKEELRGGIQIIVQNCSDVHPGREQCTKHILQRCPVLVFDILIMIPNPHRNQAGREGACAFHRDYFLRQLTSYFNHHGSTFEKLYCLPNSSFF